MKFDQIPEESDNIGDVTNLNDCTNLNDATGLERLSSTDGNEELENNANQ